MNEEGKNCESCGEVTCNCATEYTEEDVKRVEQELREVESEAFKDKLN